jgi:hypothetical protein
MIFDHDSRQRWCVVSQDEDAAAADAVQLADALNLLSAATNMFATQSDTEPLWSCLEHVAQIRQRSWPQSVLRLIEIP